MNIRKGMRVVLPVFAALSLIVLGLVFFRPAADAADVEEAIRVQLLELGDPSAVSAGSTQSEANGAEYLLYHSEERQRDYRFDASGNLAAVFSTAEEAVPSDAPELNAQEEEALNRTMAEFAERCISAFRIGTVEQVSSSHFSGDYVYEFREVYQGIPTGSRVAVECRQDGTIYYAIVTKGAVFETTRKKTVKPRVEIAISEERAIGLAERAIRDRLADGETITDDARACNLDATGEQLYYTVELSAAKPGADPTIYWVKVSTADGSILDVTATQ